MGNEQLVISANETLVLADDLGLRDEVDKKLLQAWSLVQNTYGEGDSFRRLSDDIQEAYMYTISDLLDSVRSAWRELERRRMANR
ncbi:hypothetical protein ABIE56_002122 [Luteibacter sp. 621]|uniref:hypothetical protein n=1 Tax=Luteibacter sp. 621 TaxID=3373916 RepID=UPI003D2004BF